jgi:SAM-dependent methyltransferase
MIQRSGTVFATGEKNLLENIIYNNATKQAFQKVRELTATTTSTKLKAIGGETEKIGMKLFQELDSPVSKFSASAVSDKLKLDYSNRAFKLIAGTTQEEQAAAIRIVRGSKEKGTPKIQKLANDIRKYLTDFRKEYTDVGIGLRKEIVKGKKTITQRIDPIKDYFPRVWNWDEVKKDVPKFKRVLTEIFKNKKVKDPKKSAEDFYSSLSTHNEQGFYSQKAVTELVNSIVAGKQVTAKRGLIRNLPLSDHIENDRVLSGTYGQVEKLLSQNGYLIDDIPSVFNKLITSSADSIAFARQFGPKGEILNDYIKNIVTKYKNLAGTAKFVNENNYAQKASKEIKLVMDSIDGFFGRYGQVRQGIVKSGAGILSTISNLNMLDRVTIASLGDLVQPFTNSSNFTSWIKGLSQTAIKAKNESGLAKNLGYAQSKEVEQSLLRTLTPLDDATNATNVMGAVAKTTGQKIKQGFKNPVRSANELGFKLMGLQWLTGFARRYAYNVGAVDAYASASKLAKYVQAGNSLSSAKGIRLTNDVGKYGINTTDALRIGRSNTFDDALKSKANKDLLNNAGITASNRDALIPQVSNRLLFTQSRDPLVRLMGQFMSWTLAKSAQTNKLLQRIENGDTKQLVKLLAGLPVYGGIQSLREIAKYGEVQTDLETQTDKWYSEAVRLSGVSGTATELVLGRLTGPGSREPWYLFAPVFSILKDTGNIPKEIYKGNTDKALQIFSERIAPLPTWRKWIGKLFPGEEIRFPVKEGKVSNKLKFSKGDIVDENNTDAVVVDQPFLEEAEAVASKKTIVPMKKPTVEEQVQSLSTPLKDKIKQKKTIFNNPGNIEQGQKYAGETGETYANDRDRPFVVFDSPEMGVRALAKDLTTKIKRHKGDIEKIITEYAPNNENDTQEYINFVKSSLGGKDIVTENDIANLTKAVILKENKKDVALRYLVKDIFDTGIKLSKFNLDSKMSFEEAKKLLDDKMKFNIGGLAAKGLTKLLTKNVNKNIGKTTSSMVAKDVNPGDTAITTTIGTYKKVDNLLTDLNKKSVHDFGAGIGIGTRQFKNKVVTSHEPFVPKEKIIKSKIKFDGELFEGRVPDYKSFDDVLVKEGFSSKDAVVNLNVLNVISSQTERANLVKNIAQLIKKDGVAIITTRGDDVANQAKKSKNAIKFADGWIFGKGNKKTFQKGFSQKELESYVKYVLGDNYSIEKIPNKYKISSSGVIIKKIKGDK